MRQSSTQRIRILPLVFLVVLSGLGLSSAVSVCLTEPEISGGIFPSDISLLVLGWLGGTTSTNAIGEISTSLNVLSVALRILAIVTGVLVISGLAARWTNRQSWQAETALELRRFVTVFVAGAIWWCVWLVGEVVPGPVSVFAAGVAPMWLALTSAVFVWTLCERLFTAFVYRNSAVLSFRWAVGFLAVCSILWVCVSYWMNAALYQQLFIPHGDSAMYEEHLWNVWHGKGFRSYLDQGLFLGEHIQVIHLLLLPLHILWPSHLLLELCESVALASCTIPLFLMTRRYTQSHWAAAFMGVAWLFCFPMHFLDIAIDQKTFRPIVLGLPFLFWLIEFSERQQFGRAVVCLLLALSAKEDIALITFPLTVVLAFRASRRGPCQSEPESRAWPLVVMSIGSLIYLVVVVLVVIPAFRDGDVVHYSRYFGDLGNTPGDLIRTAVSQPGKVISQAFGVRTLLYSIVFLAPLVFLPIRRPFMLSAGVATFGMLSLLQFGSAADLPPVPYHHFHAPLLPVLFWAAAASLGPRKNAEAKTGLYQQFKNATGFGGALSAGQQASLVLTCCIGTSVVGSLMPCGATFWSAKSDFGYRRLYLPDDPEQLERAQMASEVVRLIPLTARVASTDFIHTRLTHCERSYDYSKYLRAVNNYQPGVPGDTEYIVIDTRHRYSEFRDASTVPELVESDEWELLPDSTNGAFLILKRR